MQQLEESSCRVVKAEAEEGGGGGERQWSDIEPNLLRLLLSRGNFSEGSASFVSVCKSWHSVVFQPKNYLPLTIVESQSSPCLLVLRTENKSNNNLYHALNNQWYGLHIPDLSSMYSNSLIIRASNYGWLLFTSCRHVFFFNPFTGTKLQLPKLPSKFTYTSFSFFSPPTSPDCRVVAFGFDWEPKLHIFSVRRREKRWTVRRQEEKLQGDELTFCNPVAYKGRYCYISNFGDLFLYNPKQNRGWWSFLDKRLPLVDTRCHKFVVETDGGELLAVFLTNTGSWIQVFRLKSSRTGMVWESVKDLGDRVFYLSRNACFCERVVEKGTGNKIFLPRFCEHGGCLFYSLATGKYHSVNGCSHINLTEKESLARTPRSKAPNNCTWIKPPCAY